MRTMNHMVLIISSSMSDPFLKKTTCPLSIWKELSLTETAREAKTFAFKAPAEYASILSGSSIEAANLANNHSHDYGEKSYTDTISALEDAGIASFGYNRIKILKIKGIKVGVTGIYELADHQKRASQVKQNIKALKKPVHRSSS